MGHTNKHYYILGGLSFLIGGIGSIAPDFDHFISLATGHQIGWYLVLHQSGWIILVLLLIGLFITFVFR